MWDLISSRDFSSATIRQRVNWEFVKGDRPAGDMHKLCHANYMGNDECRNLLRHLFLTRLATPKFDYENYLQIRVMISRNGLDISGNFHKLRNVCVHLGWDLVSVHILDVWFHFVIIQTVRKVINSRTNAREEKLQRKMKTETSS